MIKEYTIDGITGSWLHQPGMMVYVETEFNGPVNRFIDYNYDEINRWCKEHGLIFIYAPNFIYRFGTELIEYMVGKLVWSKFLDSTSIVLKKTLPDSSFSQIKGASLLFSNDSSDSVFSYLIFCINSVGKPTQIGSLFSGHTTLSFSFSRLQYITDFFVCQNKSAFLWKGLDILTKKHYNIMRWKVVHP